MFKDILSCLKYEKMHRALVVKANQKGLSSAIERIRSGGIVAFPTETVYGLGGNALDEKAIEMIFKIKSRPFTDPLIVHVFDTSAALKYVHVQGKVRIIFDVLSKNFWPGPLTIVLKQKTIVPMLVSANTGFIGVRVPSHPIARKLLDYCGLPIAAPSANRFGHVSPTCSQHVLDDLGEHEILILDDDINNLCDIGIESTVIKIVDETIDNRPFQDKQSLIILRKGGISEDDIRVTLDNASLFEVPIISEFSKENESQKFLSLNSIHHEAPGQLLTHYAPNIESWLVESFRISNAISKNSLVEPVKNKVFVLKDCVVIDFKGGFLSFKPYVKAYCDLSPDGNIQEAAHNLYKCLRWTETTKASHLLIKDLSLEVNSLAISVTDRLFRAVSGKFVKTLIIN